ncbi:MAG: AbrB family transcriptional regulator [Deltaproteobacteria bacterium RBG_13_52_11]|nr:MAG: AbrB family transcriptional regulator [Deltaproteobacteria bacterium RBG_13_52_11]
MLAKKTAKNQITLPKAIANAFPDTQYFDVSIQDNRIILVPVKMQPVSASLEDVREKMQRLGVREADVEEAIQWARGKKR